MRALLVILLLQSPLTAHAAEPLGRLFFTPEQRAQLDTLRTRKVVAVQTKDEPPPEIVTYSGIVRSSDGKATVWVNNKALSEAELRDQQTIAGRVSRDGRILLQAPQATNTGQLQLKVGQSAELLSGQIAESYFAPKTSVTPETRTTPAVKMDVKPNPEPATQPPRSGAQPADQESSLSHDRAPTATSPPRR